MEMASLFAVIWATFAAAASAFVAMKISARPLGLAAGALLWSMYRTFFVHVAWGVLSPLNLGWTLLVLVLAATVAVLLQSGRPDRTTFLGWSAVLVAVLAPFDFYTPAFWTNWLLEKSWISFIMIVAVVVLAVFAAVTKLHRAVASILGLMAIVMLFAWLQLITTGTTGPNQVVPSPTATPSATATSATPSPSPTATETETASTAKELRATEGSIIGWDNVVTAVDKQDATWWSKLIDDNQSKLGFDWSNVKGWGKAKMADGNAVGARVIVVFDADKSDISDKAARKLVGIDSTKVDVQRATGCFTAVADDTETCPSGDQRVVVFLAPVVKVDGTIGLRAESGVALVASDGKVVLTPATYVAK